MKKKTIRKELQRAWTKGSSAYGSVTALQKATGLDRNIVEEFLHSKDSYTKHYIPRKQNFARQSAFASKPNQIWCMDVAYMEKTANPNDGVKYLLVCVDVFTRFVRARPITTLRSEGAKEALSNMINDEDDYPGKIWTDRGREFMGAFKVFCDSLGCEIYHTNSDTKAAYAERAIRSLKALIAKYLEENWLWRYIDKLDYFLDIMNSRENRSTGLAPEKVTKEHARLLLNKKPRV